MTAREGKSAAVCNQQLLPSPAPLGKEQHPRPEPPGQRNAGLIPANKTLGWKANLSTITHT